MDDINPLLKESFLLSKDLDPKGIYTWYTYATDILKEIEMDVEELQVGGFNNKNKHKHK